MTGVCTPCRSARRSVSPARGLPVLAAALAGCGWQGPQSALQPHGPVAAAQADLWWLMAAGATAVLALVMVLLLLPLRPGHRTRPTGAVRWMIPVGGLVLPTVVLAALLVHGTRIADWTQPATGTGPRIEVVGHQWWWEVRYLSEEGRLVARSVNEVRIPAGQPVDLWLGSADVIHSFWAPGLAGKMDAIPGRRTRLRIEAFGPGAYPGQCAEFCGLHHAHMRFVVLALPPADYERWLRTQPVPGDGT